MRIASRTFPNLVSQQLNGIAARQSRLQEQVATGQKLRNPADDPAAVHRVMNLEVEKDLLGQYRQNIGTLQESASATYNVIKTLKQISDRASEIAVQADDLKSPEQLRAYGMEVTQLLKQAVQVMNGQSRGAYLFAGTRSDQTAFAATTDADGHVTGVTYRGNTDVAETEIAEGSLFSVQVPGANNTGTGARGLASDSRVGADLFGHLVALQNHLNSADRAAIATQDGPALATDEENILFHVGTNGALQSRLEAADKLAASRMDGAENLISHEADADLAESMVRLSETQVAYQAALQSASTILRLSLLDYLR